MQKIIDTVTNILNTIFEWIANTFKVSAVIAPYIFYGACALVILLIVLIIVIACCKKSKKKKLAKKAALAEQAKEEVNPAKVEEVKVETKPEPVKVEEAKQQEPVKEEKVEPVKEEKVEPVKEEVNPAPIKKEPVRKPLPSKEVKVESKPKVNKVEEVKKPVSPAKRNFGKFTIGQDGPNFRYRLKASNGELLVVSELYTSEKAARTGIETIKKNAETAKVEVVEDKHGLFSFRIMTKQGRCLATSANYKTKARAISASESFKKFVVTEKIELEDAADHFEVEEFNKDITPEEKGKFKIHAQDDGYVYQLYANNGRVIATSQVYKSDVSCKEGLEKFRALAYDGTFFIFKDKNDKFQFKLYNKQKRLVLAGEVYDTKDRVISVIESIKRFAKLAEVVEETNEVTE